MQGATLTLATAGAQWIPRNGVLFLSAVWRRTDGTPLENFLRGSGLTDATVRVLVLSEVSLKMAASLEGYAGLGLWRGREESAANQSFGAPGGRNPRYPAETKGASRSPGGTRFVISSMQHQSFERFYASDTVKSEVNADFYRCVPVFCFAG